MTYKIERETWECADPYCRGHTRLFVMVGQRKEVLTDAELLVVNMLNRLEPDSKEESRG